MGLHGASQGQTKLRPVKSHLSVPVIMSEAPREERLRYDWPESDQVLVRTYSAGTQQALRAPMHCALNLCPYIIYPSSRDIEVRLAL